MRERAGSREDCRNSSISAGSAVFTDTLASMTKHSCRASLTSASPGHRHPTPTLGTRLDATVSARACAVRSVAEYRPCVVAEPLQHWRCARQARMSHESVWVEFARVRADRTNQQLAAALLELLE